MKHTRFLSASAIAATLILITCLHSSAQAPKLDKTVTVDLTNAPILTAAASILQGTELGYAADKGVSGTVTISMTDMPLINALTALLTKSNTTGRIDKGIFVMSPRPKGLNYTVPMERTGPVIRVGLTSAVGKVPAISIASSGPADVVDALTKKTIAVIGSEQVTLTKVPGGMEVTIMGKSYGIVRGAVQIQPSSELNVLAIASPKASYTRYAGILEAIPGAGTTLTIVDELPLEDYVRGVIPVEVPASFSPEAQKALVLAVRTYAIRSAKRHEASGFQLCDCSDCQGFSGASREAAWVDKLLDQTRGQIITYNNEPIYALYSTDCGGATQSNEDAGIGNKPWPYLRSVVDKEGDVENCVESPTHTWTKLLTSADLNKAFARYQSMKLGAFRSMEFTAYDSSGRVKSVKITFEKGESKITGSRFRDIFGQNVIKSAMMTLTANPNGSYLIQGKGYGHGIGMCAFGANGVAKLHPEFTYQDILRRYYTGVEVQRMGSDGRMTLVPPTTPTPPPAVITPVKPPVAIVPRPPVLVDKPQVAKPVIDTPQPPAPVIRNLNPTGSDFGPPALAGRAANLKRKK